MPFEEAATGLRADRVDLLLAGSFFSCTMCRVDGVVEH